MKNKILSVEQDLQEYSNYNAFLKKGIHITLDGHF